MSRQKSSRFTIGQLARQAAVAVDTIRFYERESLMPKPSRRASGYREYTEADVKRIQFIRRAKDLGFSLEEIRELLALESDRDNGVEAIKQRAQKRLDDLNQKIAQLAQARDRLAELVEACPGCGEPECCPILSSIHGGDDHPAIAESPRSAQSCCSPPEISRKDHP